MTTKPRIRICTDCKKSPSKGIRSIRCYECHKAHRAALSSAANVKRSKKAREGWSLICEHEGCTNHKSNNRFATKWCAHHRDLLRAQYQREYRERVKHHKIANPGKCQNAGCDQNAFSYKSKYCSPCRAELVKASKKMYSITQRVSHNENNVQVIQFVRDSLNVVINEAAQSGNLRTTECHRLATVLLQLRAWNSN